MTIDRNPLTHLDDRLTRWLAPHRPRLTAISHDLLRMSLGFVFLLFGALKFVPGLSPAEDMAVRALTEVSFGLTPAWLALVLVALIETTIGVCLLTGRGLKLGLVLMGAAMIGILSPLILFPGELFAGPFFAPTLAGQYVIKDVVLLAAALVIAVRTFTGRPTTRSATRTKGALPGSRPPLQLDLESTRPDRRLIAAALLLSLIIGALTSLAAIATAL
jgi:uncharacterized membrane protein YkgB